MQTNHNGIVLPAPIMGAYQGAREVKGAAHNDTGTVYHIWTYHGHHNRWALVEGTWTHTSRQEG